MNLQQLNDAQIAAVTAPLGSTLVLAGAGSGKTRVLTNRILYLVQEKGVSPSEILAITFTNKAAGELKERIEKMLGEDANDVNAGTFHSICSKILRRHADLLGYDSHYTIYDTDDQRRVMKELCRNIYCTE